MRVLSLLSLLIGLSSLAVPAYAADPLKLRELDEDAVENTLELARRRGSGNWVWMPIPVLNPTLDAGLAVAVLRLYKHDPSAPSSTSGMAGLATSNGSWGGGLFTQNYLRDDRMRLTGALGYANLNLNFYGFGNSAPAFERLKINQKGSAGFGQLLWRLRENLYGGVRLRYLSLTSTLRVAPEDSLATISPEQLLDLGLQLDSIGPGLKLDWDSRDDNWYPTGGQYAQLAIDTSRKSFGSDRDYEVYNLKWSGYWRVGERDVLALNGTACAASDEAPFYDICLLGSGKNLRGFEGGRYRDDSMLTGQIEYRKQLSARWGAVVFGGLGQVAPSFGDYDRANIRTSAGFGVRWVASEAHGVRLSVDLAWGDGDSAAYFYIGEAF